MVDEQIEEMNLSRINAWISKSDSAKDKFDKFISLFIAYNMFYNLYAKSKNENANLHENKKNALAVNKLLVLTPDNHKLIKNFYNCLKPNREFIFHLQNRKKENLILQLKNDLCSMKNRKDTKNESQLLQTALECLYTIRCNLFHGRKGIIPKQEKLMDKSTPLLKSFLNMAISKYTQQD
ncbi:hypothetical protein GOV04_00565 [Candidatus Woesearchaeota archaeon]|nr:hypothetical protein [Candidatus Woesearchaeota archaeon]